MATKKTPKYSEKDFSNPLTSPVGWKVNKPTKKTVKKSTKKGK